MIQRISIELTPEIIQPDVVSLRTSIKLSGSPSIVSTRDFIRIDELEPMIELYMQKATRELKEYLKTHREKNERTYKSVAEIELAITKLLEEDRR